jgi:hypothetical protein
MWILFLGNDTMFCEEKCRGSVRASRKFGLEVKAKKSKCMFMSHHRTARQTHNVKVAYKPFENVGKLINEKLHS